MNDYIFELRAAAEKAPPLLRAISPEDAARKPAPGKWSSKELIGHLIDSASNNHQRFVRAQMQGDLVFLGYAQDEWVSCQDYQSADWHDLIELWARFNRHVAWVMERVPSEVRFKEHPKHNLHEIAWRTVPADRPATLDCFMRDYVGHLNHHLKQLLPDWKP
jgi:hypothetical protein